MDHADDPDSRKQSGFRLVVWHEQLGIYLGGIEGGAVCWWSNDGTAANLSAVTFLDQAEVNAWFAECADEAWVAELQIQAVRPDLPHDAASPDALRAAGLESQLGTLAHPAWLGRSGRC